jgi:hypothetical protein
MTTHNDESLKPEDLALSNVLMNCADLFAAYPSARADLRAWSHLLVYLPQELKAAEQPQPAPMQDSTDAEGEVRRVFEEWHDNAFPQDSLLRHVAGYYAVHAVNDRWKSVWGVCSALASRAEQSTTPAEPVKEGYVLVPVDPTVDMWEAGMNCWSPDDSQGDYLEKAYAAMVKVAAPTQSMKDE